jgi:hypothetical protein
MMKRTTGVLGIVGIPWLSGCMMMSGMAGAVGMDHGWGEGDDGWQQAEARNADLTLTLSFPAPARGGTVPIDARVATEDGRGQLTDPEIWLRVRTPGGSVERVRMEPVGPAPAGAFQTRYDFRSSGRYLVTADGRVGTGDAARTVSVTSEAAVRGHHRGGHHDWLGPAAVLGGLAMTALMVAMMAPW